MAEITGEAIVTAAGADPRRHEANGAFSGREGERQGRTGQTGDFGASP